MSGSTRRVRVCESNTFGLRTMRPPPWVVALSLFSLAGATGAAAPPSGISDISISRPFVNPSLGQKIGISFALLPVVRQPRLNVHARF